MTSRAAVTAFLDHHVLALAGASRSGKKFGNVALRELRAKGFRVYPIHPSATDIDGVTCYRRFTDLPERAEAVVVVLPPKDALPLIRDAVAAGVHYVWLQQGAESDEVLAACASLGLQAIAGECVLMFAQPTGVHKLHRWVWGALGKLPA